MPVVHPRINMPVVSQMKESIMNMRNGLKVAAAAGAIIVAAAAPALAVTEDAGGGRWSHAVGGDYVYSNYYHKDNYHASSVEGRYWAKSGCTKEKVWSKASAEKAYTVSKAYYDPAC
ncbi:lactococcin 972 family bacteriocin [Streptomyces sp. NPDC005907]|uniref:lactococcin 972 family bacteriocin n=2 Tax=unclassified Streptomyces TaxID=2593676 RepID=UPI0033F8F5A7